MNNISSTEQKYALGVLATIFGVACNASIGVFLHFTDVGPITAAFYRLLLSWPILFAALIVTGQGFSRTSYRDIKLFLLGGFFFAGGFIAWNISFFLTTMANATLFGNMLPFIVIPLSRLIFKEMVGNRFYIALAITFAGILVMMYGKLNPSPDNFVGDALAFMVSVLYAFYIVVVARLRNTYSTVQTMFACSTTAMLFLLPVSLIYESHQFIPGSMNSWSALLGIAWIGHIAGAVIIAFGLRFVGPSLSSVLIMSQPIPGSFLGYIFLNQVLTYVEIIGIIIALIGLIYAQITHDSRYVKDKRNKESETAKDIPKTTDQDLSSR